MAQILEGKIVRDQIAENLKSLITDLDPKPKLVIIQIGDHTESNAYINQKIKFGEKVGAIVELKKLPEETTQTTLESTIQNLNADPAVHGIILQMPIPTHLDKDKLIELIDPSKDVDGLTTTNQKLLLENSPKAVIPATAKGVISLLKFYGIDPKGKRVTVVGRSKLVGAPLATLFKNFGVEVTVCHSQTVDLAAETKNADILAVAVGKPNLIRSEHISPNQIVIDIGITAEVEDGAKKLKGDVNFAEVEPIVAAITPVPGGIGPMTVASLFENLLEAYKTQS